MVVTCFACHYRGDLEHPKVKLQEGGEDKLIALGLSRLRGSLKYRSDCAPKVDRAWVVISVIMFDCSVLAVARISATFIVAQAKGYTSNQTVYFTHQIEQTI